MEAYDVDAYPVGWYFVAFSDEIELNSVTHVHYFGQELVLYRGDSGAVHIVDAFCPHQGAHLGWGGKVKGDDLVCPFHGWQWGPDGSNVAIPYAPRDCEALLPVWPARELDGMIFAWYHPDRALPSWEPQPVPEFSQPDYPPAWRSDPIELTVNLQDTFENGVDAAHFVSVHRAFEMPKVEIVLNEGPHFIADLPDQKLRSDRGPFDASVSSDYWGLGIDIARMRSGFLSIVYLMLQTPVDEERISVRFHITVKRLSSENPGAESPEWVARIGAGIVEEFRNDKVIWDHKVYRNRPRLAENEGPVREFRLWARQFYASQLGRRMTEDRVALITGGSGGIGRACARELVAAGFSVTLTARDPERLAAAASETGADRWIAADSADEDGAAAVAAAVPSVDVLLLVAGVNTAQVPLREVSAETFDQVIRSNLRSAFLLSKAIVPQMAKGGRVIFVSSTAAARGLPGFGAYSASKAGLRALAGALAGEIAADGINVSVLTPGPVDTSMFDTGPADVALLRPRDVAMAARYLAELHPWVSVEELTLRANRHHGVTFS